MRRDDCVVPRDTVQHAFNTSHALGVRRGRAVGCSSVGSFVGAQHVIPRSSPLACIRYTHGRKAGPPDWRIWAILKSNSLTRITRILERLLLPVGRNVGTRCEAR